MKSIGKNNIWFEFAGVKNTDLDVRMLSMPTRPHPARKGELIDVPGRNGKLFMDEGAYDQVVVTIQCLACGDIDATNGWLTGDGILRFGDEPNRAYNASVHKEYSASSRTARLKGQEFTLSFDCDPFKYLYPEANKLTLTASGIVNNPATVYSEPRIYIYGSGDFILTVNGFEAEGLSVTDGAIIDSELQETLTLDESASYNKAFSIAEFPLLQPGDNTIAWTGDIESIVIEPRWRFL